MERLRLERLFLCFAMMHLLALLSFLSGCKSLRTNSLKDRLQPSNSRLWSPQFSRTSSAQFDGDLVTVRNIRNCSYISENDFTLNYYDKTFDANRVKSVDFIVVPFKNAPLLAHTMLSFEFEDDEYLGVSAEIRTEKGEEYSPFLGVSNQFELVYVVADERDIIRLRTRHRDADVYVYPTVAKGETAKKLFVEVMDRVNKLRKEPEFYNTLTNNCTTNILHHVNHVRPNRVPYTLAVLFPGLSARYAYELGLLEKEIPFAELKRRARINHLAELHYDSPDFSKKIRSRLR